MKKVVSITVENLLPNGKHVRVNDFSELNSELESGWKIVSTEIVNSNSHSFFTIIYLLEKELES